MGNDLTVEEVLDQALRDYHASVCGDLRFRDEANYLARSLRAQPVADAWEQRLDLMEKYYASWDVRNDLKVEALGCDRNVRFSLGYPGSGRPFDKQRWHHTQRNVRTMRELAAALNAACDFVEASNPEWASHCRAPVLPVETGDTESVAVDEESRTQVHGGP